MLNALLYVAPTGIVTELADNRNAWEAAGNKLSLLASVTISGALATGLSTYTYSFWNTCPTPTVTFWDDMRSTGPVTVTGASVSVPKPGAETITRATPLPTKRTLK